MSTTPPFTEGLVMLDVEVDELLSRLRFEIKKRKNRIASLISVQRNVHGNGRTEWCVCAVYDSARTTAVASVKPMLFEALNDVLDKVPGMVDVNAILGCEYERG